MVILDPLTINVARQINKLVDRLPSDSPYLALILQATAAAEQLRTLSHLLAVPALTTIIAQLFRPVLFDLCARWTQDPQITIDQITAICLLIEVHPELFPIFYRLLQKPPFNGGLLSSIPSDPTQLQQLLVAYYRILQTNRQLPRSLLWPLTPLASLISSPTVHNGTRLLAIRCYASQSCMAEQTREELEKEMLGDADCDLLLGQNIDGTPRVIDGWVLPAIELQRVIDFRDDLVQAQLVDYSDKPVLFNSDLCPLVVNVHGVLLLRDSLDLPPPSRLVHTPSVIDGLQKLALHVSLRQPVLLTSLPQSGKSLMLGYLAENLFPGSKSQVVQVHLADTSLDARSLLGSYVSSYARPGNFEWKEGVLVRAMREGRWVVFKDIDRASSDVLGLIKPLIESFGSGKWIGQAASLQVPGQGTVVAAHNFTVFATRSIQSSLAGNFPSPTFYGSHKFRELIIHPPFASDLCMILQSKFRRMHRTLIDSVINLWNDILALGTPTGGRDFGLRDLDKFCVRLERLLPPSNQGFQSSGDVTLTSCLPNPTVREELFLDARDVFLGANPLTASAKAYSESLAIVISKHLDIAADRRSWLVTKFTPEVDVEKDVNGHAVALRVGRIKIPSKTTHLPPETIVPANDRFVLHRPAMLILSRIASAVSLSEPVLLTGETGTGKTSIITFLASQLRRSLISLNLSNQTESTDLLGGFKPVETHVPALALLDEFLQLFAATFSRKKNQKFESEVRKAISESKWKRAVALWKESAKMARERIANKTQLDPRSMDDTTPRKRRRIDLSATNWIEFEQKVEEFEKRHLLGNKKLAFDYVEGPIVKALRSGDWVLLDEINLASPETLESISNLLSSPEASIALTESGSLDPIPRHPDFRLFACMNPATDVGKKDLPPTFRSRLTEIDVPPPDADRETLLSIVTKYIGQSAVGDKAVILNVAEFYMAVKQLSEARKIADGSNHKPHFSMRTLARALTFASEVAPSFGLRRAVLEGCLMAFTMILDRPSTEVVTKLAHTHILAGVKNPRSLLSKDPVAPRSAEDYVRFGSFYLEKGPLPVQQVEEYILTPSVERKLADLSRIVLTRRFPVLIEGPTSAGKTSAVEYLARRTGHHFVRINNHEHTDIQEYLGSYLPDPISGKLVFSDGLLITALRHGHWLVLDELNLAPTDVLEALNRLLDDNRELLIPETQEVVRPHPHFMLFATQNPPGLYAGRKILSRAFRNRFLEVHFEDVPQLELETILCERCLIAPSYGKKIVEVFLELQKRRQAGRVFESKHGFATLRDLFRWAGRDAVGYQELAENGYMLLAERARREDDRLVVKEVIEQVMKVRIDEAAMYNFNDSKLDFRNYLSCSPPSSSLVWTTAMQRLFILVARALRFNEPVLLVGETGSGKTSVCQAYAETVSKSLYALNCHQNTETADLIGGLRPLRNRRTAEAEFSQEAHSVLPDLDTQLSIDEIQSRLELLLRDPSLSSAAREAYESLRRQGICLGSLFEWHDGPLLNAMQKGEIFLLDEISLADDSVLERLNSVLEPARTIVLAEKGGDVSSSSAVCSAPGFQLLATMNPGGDHGKKELSPALRNRFTEIWVPSVNQREDFELIMNDKWKHDELRSHTAPILDFVHWLCGRVHDDSLMNLRDILTWVAFSNSVFDSQTLAMEEIFYHGACLAFIDGLATLPQLAAYSRESVSKLVNETRQRLGQFLPFIPNPSIPLVEGHDVVQVGPFHMPKGAEKTRSDNFNYASPTTLNNALRVIRACQVDRPILLEGSPGVGKTSLVNSLANICGFRLHRINLSDQTDLLDLFGSDLPVEGGEPGQFAWKDAEFLKAMKEGDWVLLDEMNLAPQAVLEGLNAVLDHRGTVYIPELGQSFPRHPLFRVFAAQNPVHQGGGRKGLPKSFLNRFTKVYVQEFTTADLLLVCQHMLAGIDTEVLENMVNFNAALNVTVSIQRYFGQDGTPWEFNLRDISRWGALVLSSSPSLRQPSQFLSSIYLQRFRSAEDRTKGHQLYRQIFQDEHHLRPASVTISPSHVQVGHFHGRRGDFVSTNRSPRLLKMQLSALETAGDCVSQSWLTIITGRRDSGKTQVLRALASVTGNHLYEIAMSGTTDTMDILGSFEQSDPRTRAMRLLQDIATALEIQARSKQGFGAGTLDLLTKLDRILYQAASLSIHSLFTGLEVILGGSSFLLANSQELQTRLEDIKTSANSIGKFEWNDGPLIKAMKNGYWLLLDGANLCNPSVLDRLNSLCEPGGVMTLSERGHIHGEAEVVRPHPNFRLFMSVDPQFGELSRAMRNRGVEIALIPDPIADDLNVIRDHLRLPRHTDLDEFTFEGLRRGLHHASPVNHHASSTFGHPLDQYSSLSALVDQYSTMQSASLHPDAYLYFGARTIVPAHAKLLVRLFRRASRPPLDSVLKTVKSFANDSHVNLVGLREDCATIQEIPRPLLHFQPMDFFLRNPMTDTRSLSHDELVSLIDLVTTQLSLESAGYRDAETGECASEDERLSIYRFLLAVVNICNSIMRSLNTEWHPSAIIMLLINILKFARYLGTCVTRNEQDFDYSSVQTVLNWISQEAKQLPSVFDSLHEPIEAVQKHISLQSGLGLFEVWTLFFRSWVWSAHPELERLERFVTGSDGQLAAGYRRNVLNFMAVKTLPSGANVTVPPDTRIEEVLPSDERELLEVTPSLLLVELGLFTRLAHEQTVTVVGQTSVQLLENFLQLSCDMSRSPLLRLVSIQHTLWTIEAQTGMNTIAGRVRDSNTSPQDCSLPLRDWQWQWLHNATKVISGTFLLESIQLPSLLDFCNGLKTPLSSAMDREGHLKQWIDSSLLECSQPSSRAEQLEDVLALSIQTILACFSSDSSLYSGNVLSSQFLTSALDRIANSELSKLASQHLIPLMEWGVGASSDRTRFSAIGSCFIAIFKIMMELVVPDRPIDPAARHNCERQFWGEEEASIRSQVDLHSRLEMLSTGLGENVVTNYLNKTMETTTKRLVQIPTAPTRIDVTRLRTFWSEVQQFHSQVVSSSRIQTLIALLSKDDPPANSRLVLMQNTIEAFSNRLKSGYSDYSDLAAPVQFALFHLRIGLHLTQRLPASSDHMYPLVAALVTVPNIASSASLTGFQHLPRSGIAPFTVAILNISSVAVEAALGLSISDSTLAIVCEQATRLWLIEKAKATERERESIYKHKSISHLPPSDAELEMEDFLQLFPAYNDVLGSSDGGHDPLEAVHLTDAPRIHHFVSAIHAIFASPGDALQIFQDVRLTTLMSIMQSRPCLPAHADFASLSLRLSILETQSREAKVACGLNTSYNFYTDSNLSEAKKAAAALRSLRSRLVGLVKEWPDQMVLSQLKDRCDSALALSLLSPVAKLLSALEQILVQTDDWETYANRDNSLRDHRSALTELIVDWRRLELSSWQGLLTAQARDFEKEADTWWFQLYDAVIRGSLDASDDALSEYLSSLVPLLDDFMRSSPLGQFSARLKLLRSLFQLCPMLPVATERAHMALTCSRRILDSTWKLYGLLSHPLDLYLSAQRKVLEKEVSDLIKLASWKDVNVQTLKQSSQRTHHQLYKIIRKFRDLLREPVSHRLSSPLAGADEAITTQPVYFTMSRSGTPNFPSLDLEGPGHLKNLARTFLKFEELLEHHIRPVVISTAAELSSLSIPRSTPPEKRRGAQKAMLTRKRKAWADLLKELKRSGLASNMKSGLLDEHSKPSWIRIQPVMPVLEQWKDSLERIEIYLAKLQSVMPATRNSVSSHHADLTTRELQRALSYIESALSLAMESRKSLVESLGKYVVLSNLVRRATMMRSTAEATLVHDKRSLLSIKDLMCRVLSALEDTSAGIKLHDQLRSPFGRLSLLQELENTIAFGRTLRQRLLKVVQDVELSPTTVLVDEETTVVTAVVDYIAAIKVNLENWCTNFPSMLYLLQPTTEWLNSHEVPLLDIRRDLGSSDSPTVAIIDDYLLNIQSFLRQFPDSAPAPENDNYIRDLHSSVLRMSNLLDADKIIAHLDATLVQLARRWSKHQILLQQILPFSQRYLEVLQDQLTSHAHWVKSMLKLIYVLASVLQNLMQNGFCQPPEIDEDDVESGETEEKVEGLGIGEGSGTENVSDQVQDESQVEGLRGEDTSTDDNRQDSSRENEEGIEMTDDFEGKVEDVPDDGSSPSDDGEEDNELDEHLGDLNQSENTVDEKLWGDEDQNESVGPKLDQERLKEADQSTHSDIVAKEQERKEEQKKENEPEGVPDSIQEEVAEVDETDELPRPEGGGAMDEHIPEAETLDLPDDINLDALDEPKDDSELDANENMDVDDEPDGGVEEVAAGVFEPDDEVMHDPSDDPPDEALPQNNEALENTNSDEDEELVNRDTAGMNASADPTKTDANSQTGAETSKAEPDKPDGKDANKQEDLQPTKQTPESEDSKEGVGKQQSQNAGSSEEAGEELQEETNDVSRASQSLATNPLRNLGDALKEIQRRFDQIGGHDSVPPPFPEASQLSEPRQVEYLHPDDVDYNMQALGTAIDDQVANLDELKLIDPRTEEEDVHMQIDSEPTLPKEEHVTDLLSHTLPSDRAAGVEDAIMHDAINDSVAVRVDAHPAENGEDVEAELRLWQTAGLLDDKVERMWHLYESLTHDLAYALCEQLRLLLEPTLATRLKGDYRSGKRLNMKKIIPYIASDYTKDKIWLRRTRPSQREYQILVALDDSRSMAESHSVHLAYQTLALVTKALSRLEAGDIAIARFGGNVDVLHGFDKGPFSDQAGVNVMQAFKFDQTATNVLNLLNSSLRFLESAREQKAMRSATSGDLWQLEIIISDGICQEHDSLRSVLRKAEEQRVLVVFIIIDSLAGSEAAKSSILSVEKAEYRETDGRLELQVQRYLDSFPFQYYVVVRNVEALPDVLCATLKQFFERISEE